VAGAGRISNPIRRWVDLYRADANVPLFGSRLLRSLSEPRSTVSRALQITFWSPHILLNAVLQPPLLLRIIDYSGIGCLELFRSNGPHSPEDVATYPRVI
jgi:hypothetical protein